MQRTPSLRRTASLLGEGSRSARQIGPERGHVSAGRIGKIDLGGRGG